MAAVPEPETYAMMLVGLGLLGIAAHRRKTNHQIEKMNTRLSASL
jgi:hypothetical protein